MGKLEQRFKLCQTLAAKVSELPEMQLGQRCVEFGKKREPLFGDLRFDDAPVGASASPYHETLKRHPVEQPRQVGGVSEQPFADLTARETFTRTALRRSTQNSQDIKLRRAQVVRPEELGNVVAESKRQTLNA